MNQPNMPSEPTNCPKCDADLGDEGVHFSTFQSDQNVAWQEVSCHCGCSWTQHYAFVHAVPDDSEDEELFEEFM